MNATVASPFVMYLEHDGGEVTISDSIAPEPAQAEAILRIAVQQAVQQALDGLPLDELTNVVDRIFRSQRAVSHQVPVHWGPTQDSMQFLATGFVVPAQVPTELHEGLKELPSRLRAMNWEQQGMLIPSDATIDRAAKTLTSLATITPGLPQPEVVATPAGGIQLEWHNERFDLEVDVSSPNEVDAYLFDVKRGERHEFEDLQSLANFEPLSTAMKKML
jgi:hypothetical protein